jgi:hypothetical protein
MMTTWRTLNMRRFIPLLLWLAYLHGLAGWHDAWTRCSTFTDFGAQWRIEVQRMSKCLSFGHASRPVRKSMALQKSHSFNLLELRCIDLVTISIWSLISLLLTCTRIFILRRRQSLGSVYSQSRQVEGKVTWLYSVKWGRTPTPHVCILYTIGLGALRKVYGRFWLSFVEQWHGESESLN